MNVLHQKKRSKTQKKRSKTSMSLLIDFQPVCIYCPSFKFGTFTILIVKAQIITPRFSTCSSFDYPYLVIRPEIVAPLTAAMDFVDGQSVQESEGVALLQLGHEPLRLGQLLGSHVQKTHLRFGVSHVLKK